MTIKTYPANWEVFHNDLHLSIETDCVNSDVYDSLEEVYEDFIEKIEDATGALTDDEKENIRIECDIYFSSRFSEN